MTKRFVIAAIFVLGIHFLANAKAVESEPRTIFKKYFHLTDADIGSIERGHPVTAELASASPENIYIFGAVYIEAQPESYLAFATDFQRLRKIPGYLGVGRFSDPSKMTDLEGLTLEPDEINSLRNCKPGHCAMQLSAKSMKRFQADVDWRQSKVSSEVTNTARTMILEILQDYTTGGNVALGTYGDYFNSLPISEQFERLLSRQDFLRTYFPEMNQFLLEYPHADLSDSESMFYWEKVDFGMKPTLRLNHAITYRAAGPLGSAQILAVKQLYASHYFQAALDLSATLTDKSRPDRPGFVLVTVKASRQEGMSGLLGSIMRKVIVSKTKSAEKQILDEIKMNLEAKP